jgi:uncharacterized protein (UPF0332 family)
MLKAEDEFLLARNDFLISTSSIIQNSLGIPLGKTFFHSVIAHAYYSIFYCAKAYLRTKGVKTAPPEEHRKTLQMFKKIALLEESFNIGNNAYSLLHILKLEKRKRGFFTYRLKSEASLTFAKESIENARRFISSIKAVYPKQD